LARRAARARSAAAIAQTHVGATDREDIEQEIIVAVWLNLRRFDPLRASLRTFVERVSASKVASTLRRARAQKRTGAHPERHDVDSTRIQFAIELRIDVRSALRTLSRDDQKIARLRLHFTPMEIARVLGCSRTAVYRSLVRIRQALERFDLDKY